MDYVEIKETNRPHTFFVGFDWVAYYKQLPKSTHAKSQNVYYNQVLEFIKVNQELGLKPMIKKRYKYHSTYYITFRSKHDAMAFKLRWI